MPIRSGGYRSASRAKLLAYSGLTHEPPEPPDVLHEVLEVVLAADAMADPEHVRRHDVRVELHEAALSLPQEPRVRQQVVHLERLVRLEPQLREGNAHPA